MISIGGGLPDFFTPAYVMVWNGRGDALKKELEGGLNPNFTPSNNPSVILPTLLHVAAERGQRRIMDILREHGAIVDLYDENSNTPLMLAMTSPLGRSAAPSLLREIKGKRADPNVPNLLGYTPLFIAARDDDVKMTRLLLEAGARKDIMTVYGETAETVANHYEIKKMLS